MDAKSQIFPILERFKHCDFCLSRIPFPSKGFQGVKILIIESAYINLACGGCIFSIIQNLKKLLKK